MSEQIMHISTIAEVYQFLETTSPLHPLITIIRRWPKPTVNIANVRFTSDLYYLAMKREIRGSFQYGRNAYDFREGTMIFMSPGQVANFGHTEVARKVETASDGWTILFHPDLIRKTALGKVIHTYSYFDYDANEALHVSEKERAFINSLVDIIELELHQNMDRHSQELIIQNLETILKYANRFYDRQFYTRSNLSKDYVIRFNQFLRDYFDSEKIVNDGIPSIEDCGNALHLSGSYLSDLLRAETGKSAKDHIYSMLIERSKTSLLNSSEPVSQIAYQFGFTYPQNFSKLFKSKTGFSPSEYRNLN